MNDERQEKIFSAYQLVGKFSSLYDGMMTNSGLFGKIAVKLFWGMTSAEFENFLTLTLAGVPKNFSGRMLEIPVGTGVLTFPFYEKSDGAEIFCVDYSEKMIDAAKKKSSEKFLPNVKILRGDVGNLNFPSEFFDLVLSVNGLHVFPDKSAAYKEIFRTLKPDGIFCGSVYVAGQCRRTDFFVKNFCDKAGFFTPPHETPETLERRLKSFCDEVKISRVKSFAGFVCRKKKFPQT